MDLLRKIYRRLPGPVRGLWLRVQSGYFLLSQFISETRCDAWILSGTERHGGEPLVIGFCGKESTKHYLAKKMFAGAWREESLGRTWLRSAFAAALRSSKTAALFVSEIPRTQQRIFRPPASTILPGWTRMDVSLADDAVLWSTQKFRNTRSLVGRFGLTCEATVSGDAFDDFYLDVYLPYIAARHEGAALRYPHPSARKDFLENARELLVVKRGDDRLGGVVLGYAGGQARFWQMGLNAAIGTELMNIASDALYYFMFAHVRAKGLPDLHMGYSRAFLSDGVMEYKRRWGAKLVDECRPGERWALRIIRETAALKSFLRHNPFVAVDRSGRLRLHGFVETLEDASAAGAIAAWKQRCGYPGGIDLNVYELSPRIRLREGIPG
ncbi:MAG: hypothetical protein ACHQ49_00425 [Elusimicrobiota bacterium]